MGLDMYAYAAPGPRRDDARQDLAYWRKHNALHAWMEKLWNKKGRPYAAEDGTIGVVPDDVEFNCIELELTREDIALLEDAVMGRTLTPAAGFFFGGTDYDPFTDYGEDDLKFIAAAKAAHANCMRVFYNSWW